MMSDLNLHRSEIKIPNGEEIRLVYDQNDDILDIFFGENESATGIELTDYILLRIDLKTARAVSLTIDHFSMLTEQTEYGPRSFALKNLDELPEDLRELTLQLMMSSPVNQFLKLFNFQASPIERIPLTYVVSSPWASAA